MSDSTETASVFDDINLIVIPQYKLYIEQYEVSRLKGETFEGAVISNSLSLTGGREIGIRVGLEYKKLRLLYSYFRSSDDLWNDHAKGDFYLQNMSDKIGQAEFGYYAQTLDLKWAYNNEFNIGALYKFSSGHNLEVVQPLGGNLEKSIMFVTSETEFLYLYLEYQKYFSNIRFYTNGGYSVLITPHLNNITYMNNRMKITSKPVSFFISLGADFKLLSMSFRVEYSFYNEKSSGFYSTYRNGLGIKLRFPGE